MALSEINIIALNFFSKSIFNLFIFILNHRKKSPLVNHLEIIDDFLKKEFWIEKFFSIVLRKLFIGFVTWILLKRRVTMITWFFRILLIFQTLQSCVSKLFLRKSRKNYAHMVTLCIKKFFFIAHLNKILKWIFLELP
jgi:hypothetical protein